MDLSHLGIDAGGSSTRAVLVNGSNGAIIRKCLIEKPGNPHVNGFSKGVVVVREAINEILKCSSSYNIGSVALSLSGGDDSIVVKNYEKALKDILPPHSLFTIVHDVAAPAGLILDVPSSFPMGRDCRKYCAVVIAGTGSVASLYALMSSPTENSSERKQLLKQVSRAGGRGPILGDEGSAYKIVVDSVSKAIRVYDGLEGNEVIESKMSDALQILSFVHSELDPEVDQNEEIDDLKVNSLVASIHGTDCSRDNIAALAEKVIAPLAMKGNSIASSAFRNAASGIVSLVRAVCRKLKVNCYESEKDINVIFAGGVFQAWNTVPVFREILNDLLPVFRIVDQSANALGAARLGAISLNGSECNWDNVLSNHIQLLV